MEGDTEAILQTEWKYGRQGDGHEPVKVDWSQNLAEVQICPLSNGAIETFLVGMWEEKKNYFDSKMIT